MLLASEGDELAVSVVLITYNHAAYIVQALHSVLAQQLDAAWELIISEDCSTDGTREIVGRVAAEHSDRVRLILSETNVRTNEVVARGIHAARGKYVALLDGDDYWTDPAKLAQQFAFLEARPAYAACFHNVEVVDDRGQSPGRTWNGPQQRPIVTLADLAEGNCLATSSVMYRRALVPRIPNWYHPFFPVTDWPLHILYAEQGPIGYLNSVLGAYRIHSAGWYSPGSAAEKLQANAAFYERIDRHLRGATRRTLRQGRARYFLGWAEELCREGDFPQAARCLRWSWPGRPYSSATTLRQFLRILAQLTFRSTDVAARRGTRSA
jgi:glycosyltransferase involved in cell wall biosynthesis